MAKATVIIGSQWGDEGKGKLIDILSGGFDLCCRFNGGANAGHTVVVDGKKYDGLVSVEELKSVLCEKLKKC